MPDTDNGRVTLAVLATKLDSMTRILDEIKRTVISDHDCLTGVVSHNRDIDKDIEQHDKDIEALKNKYNMWNGINSALAVAGAAIASWLGVRQ